MAFSKLASGGGILGEDGIGRSSRQTLMGNIKGIRNPPKTQISSNGVLLLSFAFIFYTFLSSFRINFWLPYQHGLETEKQVCQLSMGKKVPGSWEVERLKGPCIC